MFAAGADDATCAADFNAPGAPVVFVFGNAI